MKLKLGDASPYVAFIRKVESILEWANQLKSDASIGNLTVESHGNVVRAIEKDMEQANVAWTDIRSKVGMPVPENGLILGQMRNRPPGDFMVLAVVRAIDGSFDVKEYIRAASSMKLGTPETIYSAVWFQPTEIPVVADGN